MDPGRDIRDFAPPARDVRDGVMAGQIISLLISSLVYTLYPLSSLYASFAHSLPFVNPGAAPVMP